MEVTLVETLVFSLAAKSPLLGKGVFDFDSEIALACAEIFR